MGSGWKGNGGKQREILRGAPGLLACAVKLGKTRGGSVLWREEYELSFGLVECENHTEESRAGISFRENVPGISDCFPVQVIHLGFRLLSGVMQSNSKFCCSDSINRC